MPNKTITFILIILLALSCLQLMGCEPDIKLTIQNNTNLNLDVIVAFNYIGYTSFDLGYLKPDQSITRQYPVSLPEIDFIHVTAKNANGDTVYYKIFSLDEVKASRYKISIYEDRPWFTG